MVVNDEPASIPGVTNNACRHVLRPRVHDELQVLMGPERCPGQVRAVVAVLVVHLTLERTEDSHVLGLEMRRYGAWQNEELDAVLVRKPDTLPWEP